MIVQYNVGFFGNTLDILKNESCNAMSLRSRMVFTLVCIKHKERKSYEEVEGEVEAITIENENEEH